MCAVGAFWVGACVCACSSTPQHVAPTPRAEASQAPSINEAARPSPRFVSPYTYEHFIRGELARAHGDLEGAEAGYRRALAGADEDPLVIARLAVTLDARGETEQARELLDHGNALDPQSEAVWLARGQIAERHEDVAAAITAYERAETFAPLSPDAPLALARLLANAPERARAVLRRFADRHERWNPHRLHAELSLALSSADLTATLDAFDALRTVTSVSQEQREAVARLAMSHDRSWLARETLGEPSPRMLDRQLWLNVLLATRDFDNARLVLAASTPEQLGGLTSLANAYASIGDHAQAIDIATLALSRDAQSAAVLVLLRAHGLEHLADEVAAHAQLRAD